MGGLRRLEVAGDRTRLPGAAAWERPRLVRLVPDRGRGPRPDRRCRHRGPDARVRDYRRRLRRGMGGRRDRARPGPARGIGGSGLERAEPARDRAQRKARAADPNRAIRGQRSALRSAGELRLGALGAARAARRRLHRAARGCAAGSQHRRRAHRRRTRRDRSGESEAVQDRRGVPVHRRPGVGEGRRLSAVQRSERQPHLSLRPGRKRCAHGVSRAQRIRGLRHRGVRAAGLERPRARPARTARDRRARAAPDRPTRRDRPRR